ncbi:hypothetical protein ACVYGX_04855 [Escherichia coli]
MKSSGEFREGANKQVISSQADSLIKISRIWADFSDRNRSHWSTSKTPSYTKSVSWQHHQGGGGNSNEEYQQEYSPLYHNVDERDEKLKAEITLP